MVTIAGILSLIYLGIGLVCLTWIRRVNPVQHDDFLYWPVIVLWPHWISGGFTVLRWRCWPVLWRWCCPTCQAFERDRWPSGGVF